MTIIGDRQGRVAVGWLILLGIVVLAWIITWSWKAVQSDREFRARTSELAQNTAHAVAVFGSKDVIAGNWGDLQASADDLVGEEPLAYVAIVDREGTAVVHTDASLRNKSFDEPRNTRRMTNVSVPVMGMTDQTAMVWVGVNVRP